MLRAVAIGNNTIKARVFEGESSKNPCFGHNRLNLND